ncbi:hypothetical protein Q4I28_000675 [Leishmania naiffi]|uniref:Uncharacterized protein n=1 Tax=Leishmania naiffi TaxID=5678 RepID=A0AAW3C867_9TRYP
MSRNGFSTAPSARCEAIFNHTDSGVIGRTFGDPGSFRNGWTTHARRRNAKDADTFPARMSCISAVVSAKSAAFSTTGMSSSRVHPSSPGAAARPSRFSTTFLTFAGFRP